MRLLLHWCQERDLATLLSQEGMAAVTKAHMQVVRQELGKAELFCLNLWCHSVPCNFDRSESVDAGTIGFPGLPGSHKNLRIPVVGLNNL